MAISDPCRFLIAYDIADPRRLARLHRYLKGIAMPVQYSVFTANLNSANLEQLIVGINEIIDESEDDVRIYPLRRNPHIATIGNSPFPDGIHVITGNTEITIQQERLERMIVSE